MKFTCKDCGNQRQIPQNEVITCCLECGSTHFKVEEIEGFT